VLGIPEDRLYGELLKRIAEHDTAGCFSALEEVYRQGLEISEFLAGYGEYLRDVLFSRQEGITPAMLGVGEARFRGLRALAADLKDGDLLRFAKLTSDLLLGLRTAPHPRLWVEMGLARMAALDRVVTLSQLLGQEAPPATAVHQAPPAFDPEPEAKKKSPEPEPPTPSPINMGEGEENAAEIKPKPSSHPSPAFVAGEGLGVRANPPLSLEALIQREPIVKTLLDMFEGRILDGPAQ
jgi:DNA polymerase III subunit gamma/tau